MMSTWWIIISTIFLYLETKASLCESKRANRGADTQGAEHPCLPTLQLWKEFVYNLYNVLSTYQRKATSGVGYSRRGVLNFNQWQKERKIQWQSSLHFSGGSLAAEQLHPHNTCCTLSPKKPPWACALFSTLFTEKVEREVSLLCGQPESKSNHLCDPVTLQPVSLHLWMVELALAWVQWQH